MQVIGHHFASWNSTEDRHILSTRYPNAKLAIVHGESRGACMHARKWLGAPQPCSQHARKWFGNTSTLLATKRLASEASPRMACGSLTRPWLCGQWLLRSCSQEIALPWWRLPACPLRSASYSDNSERGGCEGHCR